MKTKVIIGLCGGFGGVAPNLFRLGSSLTRGDGMPEMTYFIGMMVFFSIGASTALAFGETDTRKAMFLGLGLPAMFQSAAQDVSAAVIESHLMMVPVAYAAEDPPQRHMRVSWQGEVAPQDFSMIYSFEPEGRRLKDDFTEMDISHDREYRHTFPMEAVRAQALVGNVKTGARSEWMDLPPGTVPLKFVLTVEPSPFSGFKQAVGIRNANDIAVSLEVSVVRAHKRDK